MADISELKVQLTLTIGELRNLVALINMGIEHFGDTYPELDGIAGDVSGMYFELMENLKDGHLGDFEPE